MPNKEDAKITEELKEAYKNIQKYFDNRTFKQPDDIKQMKKDFEQYQLAIKKIEVNMDPSPQIVSAWFQTVINPILDNLKIEIGLLSDKYWTWRYKVMNLESIRNIEEYIEPAYRPNYEQFSQQQQEVRKIIELHNRGVNILYRCCKSMQEGLEKLPSLRQKYEDAIKSDEDKKLFGSFPEEERIKLLAQYIVNNITQLSSSYGTAPFWNKYAKDFLSLREHPKISEAYKLSLEGGELLIEGAKMSVESLSLARTMLSLKYGVPPVSVDA